MDKNSLCVKVDIKMAVERDTAVACLKIVELFVNSSGAKIIANRADNGDVIYHFD